MKKSKLIIAVGIFLALAGVVYFMSPSPDATGAPGQRDVFTGLMSGWLVGSGVGLILHRKWGLWLYLTGVVFLPISLIIKGFQNGMPLSENAPLAFAMLIVFGVPAALVWLKRDHLAGSQEDQFDA